MSDKQEKFHEYDGIIEHDNPLPTWWLATFFITIIFAFIYYIHYEMGGGGKTLTEELNVAMQEIDKTKATATSAAPMETEESLQAAFAKDGVVALGAEQYTAKCASCHGPELGGLIGPDLVDKYWIHGKGTRMDIVKVIREGVAEKGMPPWGPVMKKEEIYAVAAFILSKKGTQPAGAKGPQGEPIEDYLTK